MSEYVFFYREKNNSYEAYQHSSFRGRVELRDPEMKDGDVSVVLKNVSVNDTGTYQCRVSVNTTDSETASNFGPTIKLTVTDSGQTPGDTGHPGLIVGLSVFGGLFLGGVVVVVGLMIFRKCKERPYQRPADEEAQYEYKYICMNVLGCCNSWPRPAASSCVLLPPAASAASTRALQRHVTSRNALL